MISLVLAALGGALGAVARVWIAGRIARRTGLDFPWGTLVVNASGAFLIGLLASAAAIRPGAAGAGLPWTLLAIGMLGSYTTVSSFSLQTLALARDGAWRGAAANILLSVVSCLGAAALGLALGSLAA